MYGNHFLILLLDGWRIGQCSGYRSSPCFFRIVYTNDHLDRERLLLGAVIQLLGQNCRQKLEILSFLGYLGEIESDYQTVWTCICTIVPRSVLPTFKSWFAVVGEIRRCEALSVFLAEPARGPRHVSWAGSALYRTHTTFHTGSWGTRLSTVDHGLSVRGLIYKDRFEHRCDCHFRVVKADRAWSSSSMHCQRCAKRF